MQEDSSWRTIRRVRRDFSRVSCCTGEMINVMIQYKLFPSLQLENTEITFTILVEITRRIINLQLRTIIMKHIHI